MAKIYYTEQEAAAKLNITPAQLAAFVRDGKLRSFQDGARKMFKVADVDSMSTPASSLGDSGEITLAPADTATGVSLSEADAPRAKGKGDTVITAEGISIFDNEELEIAADPMAKTQMAPSLTDQAASDGAGSGSGLLDLTRESDDTSLGAEVLDHIDMEGTVGSSIGGEAIVAGAPYGGETSTMPAPVFVDATDASSGAFGGMLAAAAVVMIVLGMVALSSMYQAVPGFVDGLQQNLIMVLIGIVVVIGAGALVGYLMGKSAADRQAAMQRGA